MKTRLCTQGLKLASCALQVMVLMSCTSIAGSSQLEFVSSDTFRLLRLGRSGGPSKRMELSKVQSFNPKRYSEPMRVKGAVVTNNVAHALDNGKHHM
ncbi:hypothetical protein B0I37DRAFT_379002 [Chaetomium sp. MPI-CAGE-AT-0009]|nr:hypothetical protein B0I37DRAFT_379002 [Chaetomium sp. MPI-CAGE-AT-0009]